MAGEVVLDTAVVELVANTEGLRRDLQRAAKEVQKVGREMQAIGRELTASVTLPIAGIGAAAFKAAADFETALTGIAKTVDAPASAIAELGQSFRALSEEIPVSTNELAKLAELGGQLGIEVENLEGFVETMAALGVSTNLSAQEAGTALARLANIMGTSQTEFDRLGSVIVDLGNNLATTEAEIVAFSTRLAGAGRIAGLTEAEVLAIGGALSSVGIEAEAGGTAIQRVLIEINRAVAEGNESLEVFAQTAGQSAQEFQSAWRQDAGSAFAAFVEGLAASGDDAVSVLAELGLENQRTIRAFLSLANAGPLLADALGLANDAWRENTALTEEAARFYDRMAARLAQLRNQAVNVAAEFGQALAPGFEAAIQAARGLLDILRDLVEVFRLLPEWVRVATVAVAAFAAALGPTVVVLAALTRAVGTLMGIRVVASVAGWTSAFAQLAVQVRSASAALALLQAALGPAGWLIAGLTALGAGLVVVVREFGRLKREAREAEEAMDGATAAIANFNEESTRFALGRWSQALDEARAEVRRLESDMEQAIATAAMFDEPVSSGLQQELLEARQNVQALEKLIEGAAKRWTEGFGPAVDESVRSVQELADEFQRIGIGGFDASELSGLVQLQSELKRIVQDTTAAEEDRIRATQVLQQVTAEINRLRSNGKRDLQEEIDLLTEAAELGVARASDLDRLKALQEEISATLRAGVSDLERRVELRRQELQISEALAQKDDELRQIQRNLDIQQAAVAGNEELVQTLEDHDEVIRAVEKGYTDTQVAQLEHIQALRREKKAQEEAAKAADEAARKITKTLDFQAQLAAAQARAVGDELEARRILGEFAIAQQVEAYRELVTAGLASEEQLRAFAELLRENLGRSLEEATSSLAIADRVAGGLISVADSMGLVQDEARGFVRAITDILSSLENVEAPDGDFDFSGASGITAALGIAGGIVGLLGGLFGGDSDREREEELRAEEIQRASQALRDFARTLEETTRLEALQADPTESFREAGRAAGIDRGDIEAIIRAATELSETVDPGSWEFIEALTDLQDMMEAMGIPPDLIPTVNDFIMALEAAEEAFEREQAAIADNLEIRRLSALGLDKEVRAMEDQIEMQKALAEGWTDANIAALAHVQALEEEARVRDLLADFDTAFNQAAAAFAQMTGDVELWASAVQALGEIRIEGVLSGFQELVDAGIITQEKFNELAKFLRDVLAAEVDEILNMGNQEARERSRTRDEIGADFQSRTAALAGDDRGAFIARETQRANEEIREFFELFQSGVIDLEEFEAWRDLIRGELTDAIREFDRAAREAAEAARKAAEAERFRAAQDLRSLRAQLLEVQGRDAEARALRNQIELLQAIEDGRSAEYIATLRQLQAAREHARQVEEQRKAQDELNRSIASTTTALNAPAGLRLSLHRWRAMLADGVDVPSEVRTASQTGRDAQGVEEAAGVTRQVSAEIELVEPEALAVQPVLELVPPEPLMVAPQIEVVAPEVFVEAAASVQPAMDVGEVSATLQPLIELIQSDPLTFEPDIRLIQPDPLLVEPELILGSGLTVGDMGGGQAAASVSTTTVGDTHIDESFTAHIDQLVIESSGPSESGNDLLRKIEKAAYRRVRRGGADPFRKRRP